MRCQRVRGDRIASSMCTSAASASAAIGSGRRAGPYVAALDNALEPYQFVLCLFRQRCAPGGDLPVGPRRCDRQAGVDQRVGRHRPHGADALALVGDGQAPPPPPHLAGDDRAGDEEHGHEHDGEAERRADGPSCHRRPPTSVARVGVGRRLDVVVVRALRRRDGWLLGGGRLRLRWFQRLLGAGRLLLGHGIEGDPSLTDHLDLRPGEGEIRSQLDAVVELVRRHDEAGRDAGVDTERPRHQHERGRELLRVPTAGLGEEALDQRQLHAAAGRSRIEREVVADRRLDRFEPLDHRSVAADVVRDLGETGGDLVDGEDPQRRVADPRRRHERGDGHHEADGGAIDELDDRAFRIGLDVGTDLDRSARQRYEGDVVGFERDVGADGAGLVGRQAAADRTQGERRRPALPVVRVAGRRAPPSGERGRAVRGSDVVDHDRGIESAEGDRCLDRIDDRRRRLRRLDLARVGAVGERHRDGHGDGEAGRDRGQEEESLAGEDPEPLATRATGAQHGEQRGQWRERQQPRDPRALGGAQTADHDECDEWRRERQEVPPDLGCEHGGERRRDRQQGRHRAGQVGTDRARPLGRQKPARTASDRLDDVGRHASPVDPYGRDHCRGDAHERHWELHVPTARQNGEQQHDREDRGDHERALHGVEDASGGERQQRHDQRQHDDA